MPEAWGGNSPASPPHTQEAPKGTATSDRRPRSLRNTGTQRPAGSLTPRPRTEGEALPGAGWGLQPLLYSRGSCGLPGLPVPWAGSPLACASPQQPWAPPHTGPRARQEHTWWTLGSWQSQEPLKHRNDHRPYPAPAEASPLILGPRGELPAGHQAFVVWGGPSPQGSGTRWGLLWEGGSLAIAAPSLRHIIKLQCHLPRLSVLRAMSPLALSTPTLP